MIEIKLPDVGDIYYVVDRVTHKVRAIKVTKVLYSHDKNGREISVVDGYEKFELWEVCETKDEAEFNVRFYK